MSGNKIRRQRGETLLQLFQQPFAFLQAALQERQKSWGIHLPATVEGLTHVRKCLGNRGEVFVAVKAGLFEVVEQALNIMSEHRYDLERRKEYTPEQ